MPKFRLFLSAVKKRRSAFEGQYVNWSMARLTGRYNIVKITGVREEKTAW